MLTPIFKNGLRYLISKDSKPLILFVRLSGAGLFFLASIFITNNFNIEIVSDFEFANSLLLLVGSLVLVGTDISILQIAGRLKSEGRLDEIRGVYLKIIGLIFSVSSTIFLLFYVISTTSFYESLNLSIPILSILKVLVTTAFYGCLVFTAETFRVFKGSLITELYHGILKYILFFLGVILLYNYHFFNYLIDIYLLSLIIVSLGAMMHFLLASKEFKRVTEYTYGEILKISFPMTVSSLSFFILLTADVILLKLLGADVAVSIYAQPLKIIAIIVRIKVTLEATYSSSIATFYFSKDWLALRNAVRLVNRWVAAFCIPIILTMAVFAKDVLSLFGEKYESGVFAFYILLAGVLINVIAGCTGSYMNMTGKQVALQYILLIAAGLNIVLNVVLIPTYGMYGAAIASFAAILFWNSLSILHIWKKDKILMILH